MTNLQNESLLLPEELKVELSLPPTLNHSYGTVAVKGRAYFYKHTYAKTWQTEAMYKINLARKQKTIMLGPIKVVIELHLKRNRDIDSSFKLVLDTLQMAQVIKNDNQITQLFAYKIYPSPVEALKMEVRYVGTRTNTGKTNA